MRYNESLTFSPMPNTSTQKRSAPEAGVTLGATINSRPCFIYESDLQVGSLCIRIDYPRVWMSRPSERCVLGIPLCRPDFGKTISPQFSTMQKCRPTSSETYKLLTPLIVATVIFPEIAGSTNKN